MVNHNITAALDTWPMVGPHICNQVGKDILDLVADSLITHCIKRGGVLNRREMMTFFDEARNSRKCFDIYSESYDKCMRSCKSHNFVAFDEDLFGKFIINHFFHKIIHNVFGSKLDRSKKWLGVFEYGLLMYIRKYIYRDFDEIISDVYKNNASIYGGDLTGKIMFDDAKINNLYSYLIRSFRRINMGNSESIRLFCRFIDTYICKYYNITGPDILRLNEIEAEKFINEVWKLKTHKRV